MIPPPLALLRKTLGEEKVLTDPEIRQLRRHDYWVLSHLNDWQNRGPLPPLCVVRPQTLDDVVNTVNVCRETNAALIPFGLGSGVCGGVRTHPEAVLLDMSVMNRTLAIDPANLLARFEAGKNGLEAEQETAAQGFTIGHWPQSIAVSSVGGWIATRASGQFSTGYGNIEDMVHSIEAVLPNGSVIQAGKAPRAAAGPDLRHLLLGSEGTLGVVTAVTFALRRAPETSAHTCFFAPSMDAGLAAQREIIQAGWRPALMRQYDAIEAKRLAPEHAGDTAAVLFAIHEGPGSLVDADVAGVTAVAKAQGLTEAPVEIVAHWLDHRNTVPTWQSFFEKGIVVDTIEVSAPWDTIGAVYRDAVDALNDVPGIRNASAHSSHVYRTGVNLYFTFAVQPDDPKGMPEAYRECWRRVMEATHRHGGGIAHHHGIGRVRKVYLEYDLGPTGVALLRAVKRALDPTGFMNPGVLLPDD